MTKSDPQDPHKNDPEILTMTKSDPQDPHKNNPEILVMTNLVRLTQK